MKNNVKRFLAFALIFGMVIGLLPLNQSTVFAEETESVFDTVVETEAVFDTVAETEAVFDTVAETEAVEEEKVQDMETEVLQEDVVEYIPVQQPYGMTVKAYAAVDVIPEGAILIAELLGENDDSYADAEAALDEQGIVYDGFHAIDLTFYLNGEEIEPEGGSVQVVIEMNTEILPTDADVSSLSVQHLEETFLGVEVEVVDSNLTNEDSVVTANFEVDSFSVFTITYVNESTNSSGTECTVCKENGLDGQAVKVEFDITLVDASGAALEMPSDIAAEKELTIACNGAGGHELSLEQILAELGLDGILTIDGVKYQYAKNTASLILGDGTKVKQGEKGVLISYNGHTANGENPESAIKYKDDNVEEPVWSSIGTVTGNVTDGYSVIKIEVPCDYKRADDIPTTMEVDTGIHFNMFDYSIDINHTTEKHFGKEFGFIAAGKYSSVLDAYRYETTYGSGTYQGIIGHNLNSNGYPELVSNYGESGSVSLGSLGFLFGETSDENVKPYNADGLLYRNADGYYEYNSAVYGVDYDPLNERFRVRNYTERSSYNANSMDFMPLDYSGYTKDHVVEEETANYWFGLSMDTDFVQPKDGLVSGEDMIFEFSGDDDVWIFVDGVLVFEISGTHGAQSGSINFATGEIIYNFEDGNDTTIKQCFIDAGKYDEAKFEGNTLKDYSTHTMRYFYLERGAGKSNCHIKFNLQTIPRNTISVTKDVENMNDNLESEQVYKMQLFTKGVDDSDYTARMGEYTVNGEARFTDENGIFTIQSGETAIFKGITLGSSYFLTELNTNNYAVYINGEEVEADENGVVRSPIYDIHENANTIAVTNKAQVGSVKLNKAFTGADLAGKAPEGFDATFTLYKSDDNGNKVGSALETVTYADLTDASYLFEGLLPGKYVIEETDKTFAETLNLVDMGTEYTGNPAEIEKEGDVPEVDILNKYEYKTKDLTVAKIADGNMADRDKEFGFSLVIVMNEDAYTEDIVYTADNSTESKKLAYDADAGCYKFDLADGESLTFTLPYECVYTVTENDYSKEGYTTSVVVKNLEDSNAKAEENDNPCEGTLSVDTEITYTNTKTAQAPTGRTSTILPFVLMLFVAVDTIVLWTAFYLRRRRYNSRRR